MAHPSASTTKTPYDGKTWQTLLTANDSAAQENMGVLREEYDPTYGIQRYIYVKNDSGTALADGYVTTFTDAYCTKVSATHSTGKPAGVAFGTITASYYGWVQCWGYHDAVTVSSQGNIAAGEGISVSASANKACRKIWTGTIPLIGVAVAADTTTSVEAYLKIM